MTQHTKRLLQTPPNQNFFLSSIIQKDPRAPRYACTGISFEACRPSTAEEVDRIQLLHGFCASQGWIRIQVTPLLSKELPNPAIFSRWPCIYRQDFPSGQAIASSSYTLYGNSPSLYDLSTLQNTSIYSMNFLPLVLLLRFPPYPRYKTTFSIYYTHSASFTGMASSFRPDSQCPHRRPFPILHIHLLILGI